MKYAVPVISGMMSPHFGHCEQFAFFDVDEQKGEIIHRENIVSPEHQPGLLPVWLARNGAGVVIAGGMGTRAVDLLQQHGINVVLGAMESDPELARLCDEGNIERYDGDIIKKLSEAISGKAV
jgi:predicted Fe-Mo cluster-binding NifX family protein